MDRSNNARSSNNARIINNIKISCEHSVKCYNLLIKNFKHFKYERDVADFVKKYAKAHGLGIAFEPIIASGKNGRVPHHNNTDKINKGFCVIDIGLKYKGYCSDMTRMVYIGKPSVDEIKLYNKILNIQVSLVRKAVPGTRCLDLYNQSLMLLGGLKKYFIHGLGHGVGKKIHEQPKINKKAYRILRKGIIIAIEPGVYMKNFGIRIEDTILVDDTPKILTNASKELIIIKGV